MKIAGEVEAGELEIKHLYLKGVTISDTCPNCGKECSIDLSSHSIDYPIINGPSTFDMYCGDGCEFEWEIPIIFKFKLELLSIGKNTNLTP